MENVKNDVFLDLFNVNVNENVEKKEGLAYLSWAFAVAEVSKRYPDWKYEIKKFGENNVPYLFDENLGYMVETIVTINGVSKEMWLPVMDSKNKAMKNVSYEYETKNGMKTVEPATMFDINKTIMRCLVKNLAMFGLGLYIYAGEDLPENGEGEPIKGSRPVIAPASTEPAVPGSLRTKQPSPIGETADGKITAKDVKPTTIDLDEMLGDVEIANLEKLGEKWKGYILTRYNVKSYGELNRTQYEEIKKIVMLKKEKEGKK